MSGTHLILIDAAGEPTLLTRELLKTRVRSDLAGLDLVRELLAERRDAAAHEDA